MKPLLLGDYRNLLDLLDHFEALVSALSHQDIPDDMAIQCRALAARARQLRAEAKEKGWCK